MPLADRIDAAPNEQRRLAGASLTASQDADRNIFIGVGLAAVSARACG